MEAALRAVAERPGAGRREAGETRETGEEFSREDSTAGHEERPSWFELRADGFMELVRGGLGDWANGADRHMVHLAVREGV